MFKKICEEISEQSGVEIAVVYRVITAFMSVMFNYSASMIWQKIVTEGRLTQVIITANITDIKFDSSMFSSWAGVKEVITVKGSVMSITEVTATSFQEMQPLKLPKPEQRYLPKE